MGKEEQPKPKTSTSKVAIKEYFDESEKGKTRREKDTKDAEKNKIMSKGIPGANSRDIK